MQVLVAWERLLHHAGTRAALMAEAAILEAVAVAVGNMNAAVRAAARACVGLVIEVDRQRQEQEQGPTESGSTGGELSVGPREEREEDETKRCNTTNQPTTQIRTAVGERLCRRQFEAHNRAWLEALAAAAAAAADEGRGSEVGVAAAWK